MSRTRQIIFPIAASTWVATALALAVVPAIDGGAVGSTPPLLLIALGLVLGVSVNIELQFSIRGQTVVFSPFVSVLVLAALLLPVHQVAWVALAGSLCDVAARRNGIAWWKTAVNAATNALAAGAAAALVGPYSPPGPALWLAFALVASVIVEVCIVAGLALLFELHTAGSARAFAQSARSVAWFDAAVATLSATIALPFAPYPIALGLVLVAMLGITHLAAHVSTSENLHRLKNRHLRDVFSRMVPAHVADQLADSGDEIVLGGEQRDVSVLFCDIRGFTSWSEHVAPEVVITELNVLLGGLSAAVMDADGTLDKYTGDGLMAFWGAPLEQPDHAERAVSAAIDMLGRLDECNAARAEAGLPPFAIGVGVHSGNAVVGNIGHEQRLDYTAIGDTVNLSARLEAATKDVGSVLLLSESTRDRLSPAQQDACLGVGSIRVKGRTQPVEVYTLAGATHAGMREAWSEANGDSPAVSVDAA